MAEFDSSQALLLIDRDKKWKADLQHVYASVVLAADLGHGVDIEQVWLRTDHPVRIQINSEDKLTTSVSTQAACEALAEIELCRYDTVEDDLLSGRELQYREAFSNLGYSYDAMREGLTTALRCAGGIAVMAGTELAINIAAGQYEDLRSLARIAADIQSTQAPG